MTEKRFTNTDNGFIVDYESKQKVLNLYDVVNVLNELHEEKEYWKSKYKQEVEKHSIITAGVDKNGNWYRIPKE